MKNGKERKAHKERLSAKIYWLIDRALVAEGLTDAWHVCVDERQLDGLNRLDEICQIQSLNPCAAIEVRNAETQSTEQLPNGWIHVQPDRGFLALCRALVIFLSLAPAIWIALYVYNGNRGQPITKFAFALGAGFVGGLISYVSTTWFLRFFVWFCHLFCDHPKPFFKGAGLGFLGGAIGSLLIWDFSIPMPPGLWLAARLGTLVGLLAGCARAQQDHERSAQKLASERARLPATDTLAAAACGNDRPCSRTRIFRAVLAAVFITVLTAQMPFQVPPVGADASWSHVFTYAHEKGWQIGKDIVYTYGPLAAFISPYYSTYHVVLRLVAKTALSFAGALGVCLLARRLPMFWKFLLLGLFTFLAGDINPEGFAFAASDISIYTGLLCWGLLCSVESGRIRLTCCAIFTCLAVLGTLLKISFIFPAGLGVFAMAIMLSLQGNRRLSLMVVLGYTLGLLGGLIGLGQNPKNLFPLIANGLEIAKGYQDAMGYEVNHKTTLAAFITALLTLASIAVVSARTLRRNGKIAWHLFPLWLWLFSLFFVVWKYGTVREGLYQLQAFIVFMPCLALAALVLMDQNSQGLLWSRCLALACGITSLFLVDAATFRGTASFCLAQPLRLLDWNLRCLLRPTEYWTPEVIPRPLPGFKDMVGRSTVDMFGCEQACALLNGMNYHPRPVFQTLVAYTLPLISMNERFYLSESAPRYVLFALSPLGDRFPPLDDSMVLRDILINYELVESEDHFLLLKSSAAEKPMMELLREGTVQFGEKIRFSSFVDANLWVQVDVVPNIAGRLRRFLYKPPPVSLSMWVDSASQKPSTFTAPPPMLSAGFLASPVLCKNKDVRALYQGSGVTRPTAYSIGCEPGTERFWQKPIHFRVYKIDNRLGRCSPAGAALVNR